MPRQDLATDTVTRRRPLLRTYIIGLIALALLYAGWRVLFEFSPWFRAIDNQLLAAMVSVASVIVLPVLLGYLVEYGISPRLGKWRSWSEFLNLEDRFVSEFKHKSDRPVVLINWPDSSIRTLGILTSRFDATQSDQGLAAVFVPWGPETRRGHIRIIAIDEVELTGWSFKDLQLFLLSYGCVAPDRLGAEATTRDSAGGSGQESADEQNA